MTPLATLIAPSGASDLTPSEPCGAGNPLEVHYVRSGFTGTTYVPSSLPMADPSLAAEGYREQANEARELAEEALAAGRELLPEE